MIKQMKIVMFPLYTLLFLVIAWMTGGQQIKTAVTGEQSSGRVIALIRCYEETCDLLQNLEQTFQLERADGAVIDVKQQQERFISLSITAGGKTVSYDAAQIEEAADAEEDASELASAVTALEVLERAHRDGIKRFLQREAVKDTALRIVRVKKNETLDVMPDIETPISEYTLVDGVLTDIVTANDRALSLADSVVLQTVMECTFIGDTEEAEELKTQVKYTWERTFAGEPVEQENDDFVFNEKDYKYHFRPVFTYAEDGERRATVSNIGARRSPRAGHNLYDPVKVAYREGAEVEAVLLPDFSIMAEKSVLDKLNFFFEATFGRWFFPAVSLLMAFAYLVISLIQISLTIKPVKTEHADTVDVEAFNREEQP